MRPTRLLPALLLVAPLALPAFAQDASDRPVAQDRAVIEACLSGKTDAVQRRGCIGRVANPCQDTPDGASTVGMIGCFEREHAVWDERLNRAYREAMAAFDENGKAYLKGTQQAWLKFRAQACEWPAKVYPGGSIGGPLAADCRLDQTALRAIDLADIAASLKTR